MTGWSPFLVSTAFKAGNSFALIAVQLADLQKSSAIKYYEVKEKEHTCHLTDEGIRKAEELAGVESFYTAGNMEWPHLIDNALKAHHLYLKDKQYVVMRHLRSWASCREWSSRRARKRTDCHLPSSLATLLVHDGHAPAPAVPAEWEKSANRH